MEKKLSPRELRIIPWEAGGSTVGDGDEGVPAFSGKERENKKKGWFVPVNWAFWAVVKKAYLPHTSCPPTEIAIRGPGCEGMFFFHLLSFYNVAKTSKNVYHF
jgi:hypothetical protein